MAASAALDMFLAELHVLKAQWEPELEGFRDFARLDIEPSSLVLVQERIALYERRLALVDAELARMEDLIEDGYPLIPPFEVPTSVQVDLAAQLLTQQEAFQTVVGIAEAVRGVITPGALEPAEE
jgi:hypothetical protein